MEVEFEHLIFQKKKYVVTINLVLELLEFQNVEFKTTEAAK